MLLALAAQGRAVTLAQIQPILKLGDAVGDHKVKVEEGNFEIGSLNDNGLIALVTPDATGGDLLVQYDGQPIAIVAPGGDAPGGKWAPDVSVLSPVPMNLAGNMVFAADVSIGGVPVLATFRWDQQAKRVSTVAQAGMADIYDFTFEKGGNWITGINNNNEIALVAGIRSSLGEGRTGDFLFRGALPFITIAVPGQILPDGRTVLDACHPTINDSSVIAFLVRRQGDPDDTWSAYRWRQGVISPVAVVGQTDPLGKKIVSVYGVWVNNNNSSILVAAGVGPVGEPLVLYRFNEGRLVPVVVPGQPMPGGGKLLAVQDFGISYPNDLGQHAFLATLEDGTTAAYLLNPDGSLSLLLASGTPTDQGAITNVGQGAGLSTGIALNNKGQAAFTVRFGAGPDTVILFTP
jgi:hypothetical protein